MTITAGDFTVYGPGGDGEDPTLECPHPNCHWTLPLRYEHCLDELTETAQKHLNTAHPNLEGTATE